MPIHTWNPLDDGEVPETRSVDLISPMVVRDWPDPGTTDPTKVLTSMSLVELNVLKHTLTLFWKERKCLLKSVGRELDQWFNIGVLSFSCMSTNRGRRPFLWLFCKLNGVKASEGLWDRQRLMTCAEDFTVHSSKRWRMVIIDVKLWHGWNIWKDNLLPPFFILTNRWMKASLLFTLDWFQSSFHSIQFHVLTTCNFSTSFFTSICYNVEFVETANSEGKCWKFRTVPFFVCYCRRRREKVTKGKAIVVWNICQSKGIQTIIYSRISKLDPHSKIRTQFK